MRIKGVDINDGRTIIRYTLAKKDFNEPAMYHWARGRTFKASTHCCYCNDILRTDHTKAIAYCREHGQWCQACLERYKLRIDD